MSRCPGHGRHWFTVHGAVGLRRPDCARCGAPNPRPLTDAEQREFNAYADHVENLRDAGAAR